MQGEKARQTQKLLHRLREVGPTANPMPDPLQVQGDEFFPVTVGQWIIRAHLLHKTTIPGTLVVSSNNAVKGPVGAATESKADG